MLLDFFRKKQNSHRRMKKLACPCCGFLTLLTGPGNYDVCPVCFWEDDPIQRDEPDFRGGANRVSLNEARENYQEYGACEEQFMDKVRTPFMEEWPD